MQTKHSCLGDVRSEVDVVNSTQTICVSPAVAIAGDVPGLVHGMQGAITGGQRATAAVLPVAHARRHHSQRC